MRPTAGYGDLGFVVDCTDAADVLAVADTIVRADVTGVVDVVPAATSVLVRCRTPADVPRVRRDIGAVEITVRPGRATAPEGRVVTIPVDYDGPDLDEVAQHAGLTVADVVAAHTAASYTAAFCGFRPGFAYLIGLDPRLQVPRRVSPRTSVPAGAVAVAGRYTGVYPAASPGGWQLIGRTHAAMWDSARQPPALVTPGTTVRFTAR